MCLKKNLTQRRRGAETQRKKWKKIYSIVIYCLRYCHYRLLRKVVFGWLCLVVLALGTACESEIPTPPPAVTPTAPPQMLRIGLTGSAAEIMALTTGPFEAAYPQTAVQFITANNRTLLADLAAGQLDAVLVHHIPAATSNWFNPAALDGLVIIVHPDNPVTALSTAEIQAVFNGRITNWSSLGGPDMPIEVVSREQGAGSRILFSERIMLEQRISITAQIVSLNNQMIETVAGNSAAIGYSMMGAVDAGVRALAVEGIMATLATTADQSYSLTTPLYFVSSAEPTGDLRLFLAWLQSEVGQMVIGEKYGRVR
jgi:ABC-type phosphate transport system substrate-binding protein